MPKLDWLWQGVLLLIIELLLLAGAGLMMGLLRGENPLLAAQILYGLAGAASLLVLSRGIAGIMATYKEQSERVTAKNVRGKVEGWLGEFGTGFEVHPCPKDGDEVFHLAVKPETSQPRLRVAVAQKKEIPRYLILQVTLGLYPRDLALWKALTPDQQERVAGELRMELSRSRIGYAINLPEEVVLQRRVAITSDLTEGRFMDYIDEMASDAVLASDRISLNLDRMAGRGDNTEPQS